MLGLGVVGSAVARILAAHPGRLEAAAARPLRLGPVLVRNAGRQRGVDLGPGSVTTDAARVVEDPGVGVVLELMGGIEPARSYVIRALRAGKPVVTANKALLAEHGTELFAEARRAGVPLTFEASVGGGIPIVHALSSGLAANRITAIAAILNGTCNSILTSMSTQGLSYEAALAQAQRLGYAAADPTLDVDGTDSAHKLAVLAQLAFRATVRTADVPRKGIDRLHAKDLRYARELGYTIKLLAHARRHEGGRLELRVAPRLVRVGTPLADVKGAYNAIRVVGDVVGETLFYGPGAGGEATASSVLADLIDVATGGGGATFASQRLWDPEAPAAVLAGPEEVRSRCYLRFTIADQPGVIGAIAQVLGAHRISIASVIQHDPSEEDGAEPAGVPLILMTQRAAEAAVAAAVEEIDRLEVVRAATVCHGVEE
jgi:homoserine dehydrogenase